MCSVIKTLFFSLIMCSSTITWSQDSTFKGEYDLQGHRGCRGLYPENTIPAFRHALALGVSTLELDVVVSADLQVVVSHEPWISGEICSSVSGKPHFGDLTYDRIRSFDCGSKHFERFPDQKKLNVSKPLLSEVLLKMGALSDSLGRDVAFNIEIKSRPSWDGVEQPGPDTVVPIVMNVIAESGLLSNCTLQSFDFRVLRLIHESHPQVPLSCLVEMHGLPFHKSVRKQIKKLGFVPSVYSPNEKFVNQKVVEAAHLLEMKIIPWTINDPERMKKLLKMGVDGIITDYPDRAIGLLP